MSDSPESPAPKKGSKKLLVIALAVLLLGGGGGGAWWWTHRAAPDEDEEAVQAAAAEKKKHEKPLFTTLEPFTVNLKDPRGERFAQVGVTLQFSDPHIEQQVKDHLPAIRNAVLMLISSKQIDELLTVEGKQRLAEQIRSRSARAMGVEVPEDDGAEAPPKKPEPAQGEAEPKKTEPAHGEAEAKKPVQDEAATVAKKAEGAAAQGDDEDHPKPKKKKKANRKPPVENPIDQVLFSQFIVQ